MLKPKTAQEIMVTKLHTLAPDKHVYDGISQLLKHNITGAPVVDKEYNFLGVFSEKCSMNVLDMMARSAWEEAGTLNSVQARDFMETKLITLKPDSDVFDAIDMLLKKRISGAPVLNDDNQFLGVFSEKNSMQVLISAAYEQLPTTRVEAFMNQSPDRVISSETDLFEVAEKFLKTPLRRLTVVEDGKVVGQISRRDVLRTEQHFSQLARHRVKSLANQHLNINDSDTESPELVAAPSISFFMDRKAHTIGEETDFLSVARIFLDTPYRRLPVVRDGKLVGQISRRDVLNATNELIAAAPPPREKSLLYLSSLVERQDAPFG